MLVKWKAKRATHFTQEKVICEPFLYSLFYWFYFQQVVGGGGRGGREGGRDELQVFLEPRPSNILHTCIYSV